MLSASLALSWVRRDSSMYPFRKRNPDQPLGTVLQGDWRVPALVATVPLLLVYLIVPLVGGQDSVLAVVIKAAVPFAWFFALVFGAVAVVRRIGGKEAGGDESGSRAGAEGAGPETEPARDADPSGGCPDSSEPPREWSIDVLRRMEWKRFEDLCCAFYREKGIRALTTPLGPEGGVDIHLFQDAADPARITAIVQCRAQNEPVGEGPVRRLHELMGREAVDKAFFMAPGGFTGQARAYAAEQRIVLLDGRLFLAMLRRLPAEASARLLEFATEGDWTVPTCPNCGVKLVARRTEEGLFWGCRLYPNCRCRLPMGAGEPAAG